MTEAQIQSRLDAYLAAEARILSAGQSWRMGGGGNDRQQQQAELAEIRKGIRECQAQLAQLRNGGRSVGGLRGVTVVPR